MPYWLLTSTTYGTWLPGDPRGSVTSVRDVRPGEAPSASRREHSDFGEAYEPAIEGLQRNASGLLKSSPVRLSSEQARLVVRRFRETCGHRGWRLAGASVMANHFHVVLGCREACDGRKPLTDLKAYASRGLNRECGEPASGRWWTRNGSRRRLLDERALRAATHYVLHKQKHVLAKWPEENEP